MGLHSDTPIHKTTYDLLGVVVEASRNMPRDVKRLVGEKIRDELLEAFDLIYDANTVEVKDRAPRIEGVRKKVMRAELLLRLAHDHKFISQQVYSSAIKLTESVARQATGWKKHSMKISPAS